jgi:hypothetical protein
MCTVTVKVKFGYTEAARRSRRESGAVPSTMFICLKWLNGGGRRPSADKIVYWRTTGSTLAGRPSVLMSIAHMCPRVSIVAYFVLLVQSLGRLGPSEDDVDVE